MNILERMSRCADDLSYSVVKRNFDLGVGNFRDLSAYVVSFGDSSAVLNTYASTVDGAVARMIRRLFGKRRSYGASALMDRNGFGNIRTEVQMAIWLDLNGI